MNEDTLVGLFEQALGLPMEEREAFVARACGDDKESMARLRAMLAADAIDLGILDVSVQQVAAEAGLYAGPVEDMDETGRRIGNYRLVQRLGRGGMGVVYRAERDDGMFAQVVALKLIRQSKLKASAKARFLRERAILAQMKHPHIAHVVDGGLTENDEPWFAMEYVDGDPLLSWCDAKQLDIAARVRRFLPICEAAGFAHGRLVVHRDITPANVLIDSNGVVKLLDFGIAKLLHVGEADDESVPQERAFTPRYASPEQIRGEAITVATDIHALGLLLYELLCGRPAYEGNTLADLDMRREMLKGSMPPMAAATLRNDAAELAAHRQLSLPALRQILSGELQCIVTKATSDDPERRYRSAADLADDLRSYLADKPVAARSGGFAYRARKFIRRNRIVVSLTAFVVLTMLAGLLATGWQYHRMSSAVRATEAVDRLFTATLGNAVVSGLGSTPFSSAALLDKTEHELRSMPLADQPSLYAHGLANLARSYAVVGNYSHAESLSNEAQAIADDRYDDDGFVAATRLSLLNIQAHYVKAEQLATRLIAQTSGRDDIAARLSRITFQTELAQAQWGKGDTTVALQTLDQVLATAQSLGSGHEELLTQILILRSQCRLELYRFAEAKADAERAFALAQPINPILADDARERLVDVQMSKVSKDSVEIAQQLLEGRRKTLGERHPKTGTALLMLSFLQGQGAAGEKSALEGRRIIEAAYGRNHPAYAQALLADDFANERNIRDVIAEQREALRIYEQTLGPRHTSTINTRGILGSTLLFNLADADRRPEDTQEGLALLQTALDDKRAAGIPAPSEKQLLGNALVLFGTKADLPRAEALLREAQSDAVKYFAESDVYPMEQKWFWNQLRYHEGYREEADRNFADWIAANRDYIQGAATHSDYNMGARDATLYTALTYRALYAFETCRKKDAENFLSQLVEFNDRVKLLDDKLTRGYLESLRKANSFTFSGQIVPPSESAAIKASEKKCGY